MGFKLIAHRGNTQGKTKYENHPNYVMDSVEFFDCEIDVWFADGWFLGHDKPQYEVPEEFLKTDRLWCHAKTIETLYRLMELGVHCFFHDIDDVALTSGGYLWTYPNRTLTPKSISVLPETNTKAPSKRPKCAGVCSDYIVGYR